MAFSTPQLDMLGLVYEQYRNYTVSIGLTHQKLSKQYKKLAKAERVLSERQERQLSRDDRKRLQYSRVLTKRAILGLEAQQENYHDHLRQCSDLIASLEHESQNSPMTPWTAHTPPLPFMFTPFSPAFTRYTPNGHRTSFNGTQNRTQYWDLSMLAEPQGRQRRQSSPYASTADSGYYEPGLVGLGMYEEPWNDSNHVYPHELMSLTYAFNTEVRSTSGIAKSSQETDSFEGDEVPDSQRSPVSPARVGAQSSHKRCYSANAVQLNESHLAPLAVKRGTSVGPASSSRINSDGRLGDVCKETKTNATD